MTKVSRLTINDGADGRGIHLREVAEEPEAPLETVGQDLRTARLRRGDDLATVSRALKIRRDHLEAIEEDRLDALPGRAYAIGFVRSYADYLGLDQTLFVDRFKAEIVDRSEPPPTVQVIEEHEQTRLPQGWIAIAGVAVLVLFYVVYHYFLAGSENAPAVAPPPRLAMAQKHTGVPPPKPATHAIRKVATNSVKPPPARVNAQSVTEKISPPPTPNAAPAKSSVEPEAPAKGPDRAPAQPTPAATAALPTGQVYGQQNRNARVILRVHTPTKLLVLGPSKMIYINRT
ncbi:MAG: helix-turn-helix domain-containing protein, partial [Alphaproteobacteria bacterium]|nr:helix-turn-helix domain-containing protein [Alphaproteobacteria bacterium]